MQSVELFIIESTENQGLFIECETRKVFIMNIFLT